MTTGCCMSMLGVVTTIMWHLTYSLQPCSYQKRSTYTLAHPWQWELGPVCAGWKACWGAALQYSCCDKDHKSWELHCHCDGPTWSPQAFLLQQPLPQLKLQCMDFSFFWWHLTSYRPVIVNSQPFCQMFFTECAIYGTTNMMSCYASLETTRMFQTNDVIVMW
jgi:hypothetical protein